jgi:uncharacterized protein (DUF1330 family)
MAKGYWIARVDIHDPEAYKAYVAGNGAVFRKFGAKFLVRGGAAETVEGSVRQRNVILEFPSYAQALACYRSPEYQPIKAMRTGASDADIVIVEGYDGPQP